ncbi:hypothetical protein GCM10009679_78490 [Saccharothrix algeriensis]|uniref:Uncharacterized protein n=1 Tax=Catellatospora bangladeshensis TaxID=310355 RepID=A0A8J3NPY8_9ACTN|nr:hypothetical protein Cba03nite_78140 [Catellatospora bangladeshensis]
MRDGVRSLSWFACIGALRWLWVEPAVPCADRDTTQSQQGEDVTSSPFAMSKDGLAWDLIRAGPVPENRETLR